ncbi:MAG: hypothetical protein ABIQ86_13275 [Steroidobacteraceae bacterium]
MNARVAGLITILAAGVLAPASTTLAAGPSMGPFKPADWASLAQRPDLSGVWENVGAPLNANSAAKTPAAAEKLAKYRAATAAGQIQNVESANCIPPGIPINMAMPYPIELLITPGKVTMIMEAFTQVRHIYTDGRALPEDPDPTYNGTSIGHWEGDALVAETIGFLPETEIAWGLGHSDKLKIVERMRLADPDKLEIQFTITDPAVLTAPWVVKINYKRRRTWGIREYVCAQNNRHNFEASGKTTLDLN